MARFLDQRARFVGVGRVSGRLYDLGRFPGMVPAETTQDWVRGDLFELTEGPDTLGELDRYENGGAPASPLYERQLASVILEDGKDIPAWVYWYRGEVKESHRISSGDYQEVVTGQGQEKSSPSLSPAMESAKPAGSETAGERGGG